MAVAVGLKLGCTCACLAASKVRVASQSRILISQWHVISIVKVWLTRIFHFQDGKTDIVANDAGERITPALVAFAGNEKVSDVVMNLDNLLFWKYSIAGWNSIFAVGRKKVRGIRFRILVFCFEIF